MNLKELYPILKRDVPIQDVRDLMEYWEKQGKDLYTFFRLIE